MAVESSIFKSTKIMLDIAVDDPSFDGQVMGFINSSLATLWDMGVGPVGGLYVTGDEETWEDFRETPQITNWIKTWLYLQVRILFDPPTTGFLVDAHTKQIDEATWRLVDEKDAARYAARHNQVVIIGEG